ncbi:MAG TPA: response regulator [Bryobacteraceae bacterium]|nr:response regulator [Bryobacteraceae bacterium]
MFFATNDDLATAIAQKRPPDPENHNRFQILLVDDSASDSHLFQTALQEASARVKLYWVASGEEALEYVEGQGRFQGMGEVDVVVLDLNMQGMDGFEVLQRLRKTDACRYKPIVVLSSSKAARDIRLAYSLGANSYIVKSMSFERYVESVSLLVRYWFDTVELPN